MKRLLRAFALACLLFSVAAVPALAQTTYFAALPNSVIQFFDDDGLPLSGGLVYTYQAGTVTPQATYTDSTGASQNANPVVLDSAGRAAIWLASTNPYKLVVETSTGTQVWTKDNVSDFGAILKRDLAASFVTKSLDGVKAASTYSGANAGAQYAAAIVDVPSSGGLVSGAGLGGAQAWTSDFLSTVSKPLELDLGAGTTTISANITVPSNVTLKFNQGSILSINSGKTLTINGSIDAPHSQIFAGSGTIVLAGKTSVALAEWFPGATAGAAIVAAASAFSSGGVVDARGLTGAQTINAQMNLGSKPIHLILGYGTYSSSVATVGTLVLAPGSIVEGQGIGATSLKLTVDGASAINSANNATVRNLTIEGNTTSSAAAAIDGGTSDNFELDHVELTKWGGHCVNLGGGSTHWNIHDSYIHDCYEDGVFVPSTSSGADIHDNVFASIGSIAVDLNGTDNHVHHNTISGSGGNFVGTGIDCYSILVSSTGSAANADSNTIDFNRITGSQCQAIAVRADNSGHANYTKIRGNIISDGATASSSGINLDASVGASCGTTDHTEIVGNTIYNGFSGAHGILVGGGAGTPCIIFYTKIEGNIVNGMTGTGKGIFVVYGNNATIRHNTSLNNAGGNLDTTASTLTITECNLTDATVAQCPMADTLVVDTIRGYSGNGPSIASAGNTEFHLKSDAASTLDFGLLLDGSNNAYLYDYGHGASRATFNGSGNMDVPGSFSIGGGGPFSKSFTGVATLDFPSTSAQSSSDLTISVTGVADQDECFVGPPAAVVGSNAAFTCFVSGANTVTVRYHNYSSGSQNPGSGQFKVGLFRF